MGGAALGAALALGCWDPLIREVFPSSPGDGWDGAPGAVGEACIPEDEDFATFGGFSLGEVNISTEDPRCVSGTCLVNHFQGRVSCPEGNLDGGECFTPSGQLVAVEVQPHLAVGSVGERVHCSCRCGGPDRFGPFCECPAGMTCAELIRATGGDDHGEGAYCVWR